MTLIWLLVILVWTVVSGTFLQAHDTLANVDSGFHIFVLRVFILLLLPFLPRFADFAHILVNNVPLHAVIFSLQNGHKVSTPRCHKGGWLFPRKTTRHTCRKF